MGQDKPPQYSDAPLRTDQYTPKFSHEQISFLSLVHQFAAVRPLSLKIFLNLVSEDDELFSKEFPEIAHEPLVEEVDAMLVDPTYKPLLSAHLAKQDYSAALVSIVTLLAITPPNQGVSSQHSLPRAGTNAHDQPPPAQAAQTSQEKPPSAPDSQSTDQYAPKSSPEQKSFLDLVHRFASVKPLSLRIFLNLVSEDDDLLSKELPGKSKELIGAEIDGMLTNPTFKPLLSAHLAKRDYSAALISVITLVAISIPAVDIGGGQPSTYPDQLEGGSSNSNKTSPDLIQRFAAAEPLTIRKFLDIIVDDVELLSSTFPERSMGSIAVEIDRLSVNPSFQRELGSHLERQDYLSALLLTTARITASSSRVDLGIPQHGVPLEQLDDPYSKGLYGLYDLLWNRQEKIIVPQTTMVPNLPYGYINFEQSAPTAILPGSFGVLEKPYPYRALRLPDDSDAILPVNGRQLKNALIRSCYRDIHNELELDDQHAVVLGQPGTGKSCLLAYILTERLQKRQATFLQLDDDDVYSFSESGAMRFPARLSFDDQNLHNAWFLVDCSDHRQINPDPPPSVYRLPFLKVVHTVSPRNSRYMAWSKQSVVKEIWMYIYSWEELYAIGSIGFAGLSVDSEKLAFSFLKYGANPQVCMLTASSTAHDTKQLNRIQDELKGQNVIAFPDTAASSPTLHAIVPLYDSSSTCTVVPASSYLAERFYQRERQKGNGSNHLAEFTQCWKAFDSILGMFETWCRHKLAVEIQHPKVAISQAPMGQQLNYQNNAVIKFADLENLKKTCSAPNPFYTLLVPDGCAFPVDAVLYYGNSVHWLILFTAGMNRMVDEKALEELLQIQPPGGRQDYWKFLLVVPELCDCIENIRVDIDSAGIVGETLKNIPKYVLRL